MRTNPRRFAPAALSTIPVFWVVSAASVLMLGVFCSAPALAQNPRAPFAGEARAEEKDPAVEKLVAAAQKLEKQHKAKPKDAKLKTRVAEAWYKAGHELEYSRAGLSPRTRYRGALKYYRLALQYNPAHKQAAAEKKQIEDIYKQMGMQVPK